MKCSSRNAPMGTMPVKECRRRSRNEFPSPARRGATPGLIRGTVEAVDATMGLLCEVAEEQANRTLSVRIRTQVKGTCVTVARDGGHKVTGQALRADEQPTVRIVEDGMSRKI